MTYKRQSTLTEQQKAHMEQFLVRLLWKKLYQHHLVPLLNPREVLRHE